MSREAETLVVALLDAKTPKAVRIASLRIESLPLEEQVDTLSNALGQTIGIINTLRSVNATNARLVTRIRDELVFEQVKNGFNE